jgi:regulator of protease activity HflC (stomatin/prohibitin superfamily)
MTELLRLVVDFLKPLWPVRVVWEYQRGVYYVGGRYWRTVGPGLKLVVPYLCDVVRISVVPEIYTTPLQTVTLRDGSTLTYSASITVVVTDPAAAWNRLGHYTETVVELAASILSEGLADADPERFDPARGKRDRLLNEQREAINAALAGYGLELAALRLNNFCRGVRTLRLLLDRAVLGQPQPHPETA